MGYGPCQAWSCSSLPDGKPKSSRDEAEPAPTLPQLDSPLESPSLPLKAVSSFRSITGDVDPSRSWIQDEGRVQPSTRSFTSPAPSWEVKAASPRCPHPRPTPKSSEFHTPTRPSHPQRCHGASPSLHPIVPKGWGQGQGRDTASLGSRSIFGSRWRGARRKGLHGRSIFSFLINRVLSN